MKPKKTTSPAAIVSRDTAAIGTARNIALNAAKVAAEINASASLPKTGELSPGLQYVARKLVEERPKNLADVKDAYKRRFPQGLEYGDQQKVFAYVMANITRMNGASVEAPITVAAMR